MTKQRKIIYEVVQASDAHMTAEEIFLQAKKKMTSCLLLQFTETWA